MESVSPATLDTANSRSAFLITFENTSVSYKPALWRVKGKDSPCRKLLLGDVKDPEGGRTVCVPPSPVELLEAEPASFILPFPRYLEQQGLLCPQ